MLGKLAEKKRQPARVMEHRRENYIMEAARSSL